MTGLCVLPWSARALEDTPPPDTVVMVDGTTIVGRVVKQEPGSFVTIALPSGEERTLAWSRIAEVKIAPKAAVEAPAAPSASAPPSASSTPVPVPAPPSSVAPTESVPPASNAEPDKPPTVTQKDRGVAFEASGTLEGAEQKRQAWKKRGGALFSLEAHGDGTFFNAPGASGYGGGLGGRIAMLYLSLPDPEKGSGTWYAFKLGVGYEWSTISASAAGTSLSVQTAQLPCALGGHVGLGGYGDSTSWSGVVLGLSWAPAFSSSKAGSQDPTGSFNSAGAEVTLDFTTLDAVEESYAKKAHWRINAFLLPPVTSAQILLASVGFGAVWY
jgi:hypothetical protein